MNWGVIVPSVRPASLDEFLKAWMPLFEEHSVSLYVMWDMEEKPTRKAYPFKEFWEENWPSIPEFIPRQTDMIRSWGFYRAWQEGCDYILSLDDDVRPTAGDIFEAYEFEFQRDNVFSEYLHVGALNSADIPMRGFPYKERWHEVAVQYGGWYGVPDLDAVTQLHGFKRTLYNVPARVVFPVPRGVPMTTCAMNFAFKREFTPLMWQMPMLQGRYNRFGDIWSGLIQKHTLDLMGKVMLLNQRANVSHARASDPFNNLRREALGLEVNEGFWNAIKDTVTIEGMWRMLWEYFQTFDREYADHLLLCKDKWLALFS